MNNFKNEYNMKEHLTAKEIASSQLHYIDGLATVKQAVALMKEKNVETLIIQKRDERDANGIITVSDIIGKVIIPDKQLEEVSVYEIMTKPVISIPAHLNSRYVPRLLHNARISVAPVEENGVFLGIIHLKDFLFNTL